MKSLIPCFTAVEPSSKADISNAPRLHSATVFKTFNSLFEGNTLVQSGPSHPRLDPQPDPDSDSEPEPDFAAAFASRRFFFSTPGRSNSITESCPSAFTMQEESMESLPSISCSPCSSKSTEMTDSYPANLRVEDSVAVDTYSPDPYVDFRRSMEEMIEARGLHDVKGNWEKLHELLLCYLALNPSDTHRFIVPAFADLLITLMSCDDQSVGKEALKTT